MKECGDSKSIAVVGKFAGEKWKGMSATAKKPYEDKAVQAKTSYEKAVEDFKAAGGVVGQRRQEKKDAKQGKDDKKAKKEARKNSGAPKRPPSGFWLWQTENRDALVKEAGTSKIPVIAKLAGEKWGKTSAADKAPFEKRAEVLKAEYTKALEEWKAANPGGVDGKDEDDAAAESPAKKARTSVASPKAKGKAKVSAKGAASVEDTIDATVLKKAQDAGMESQLKNLAKRDGVKAAGVSTEKMLKALIDSNGLVNKANQALMAGA